MPFDEAQRRHRLYGSVDFKDISKNLFNYFSFLWLNHHRSLISFLLKNLCLLRVKN
jgi:hypothetical protein